MSEVSILFTGDFCAQLRNESLVVNSRFELLFNDVKAELNKNDLNVVDLESPLVLSGKTIHKTGPHLKAHPASVKALNYANIGLVAMANNHIMDYGEAGLLETLSHCREAGIATVGVGRNLSEARKPFSTVIKDRKIAILNFTENEWSKSHGDEAGANPLDVVKNFYDIQRAKSSHDFVIVIFHGGNEHYELPSPRLKELFHFFVEAGASAVIGHHTHVVSGYEVYNGAPLFYSLGNFCFDWSGLRSAPWNIGMAVRLLIGDTISFEIIPFRQSDDQPGINLLKEKDKANFESRLDNLNKTITNDKELEHAFKFFCESKKDIYNIYLEPYRISWLASLRKRKLIPSVFSAQKKRLILNITRCESHRDVLFNYLKE
jgi:poly-gamma-glutamate capsule biosynthesis protein CapA/YwtB (metallophosphatase superfamily)